MSDDLLEGIVRDFFGTSYKKTRKRKKIPKHIKMLVWKKYFGAETAVGKCYVCGEPIHISNFEVGHNRAVAKGGSDDINNLRPICRGCNLAMGTMSIEDFKKKYFSKKKTQRKTKTTRKRSTKKAKKKKKKKDELDEYLERVQRLVFG